MDQLAQPGPSKTPKEEDLPKGEPVTLFRSLRDGPRVVDQLLLAPRSFSTLVLYGLHKIHT